MKVHELKTWPAYYAAVYREDKRFEVRKNDRDFKQFDVLHLKEWSPEENEYTGAEMMVQVEYVLEGGAFGIEEGFCVMSVKIVC